MTDSELILPDENHPFGESEEHAIISMILDIPEFFSNISEHIKVEMFRLPEARHVIQSVMDLYKKYGHVPPRGIITDHVKRTLTTAHDWRPIIDLLKRPLDPREAPMIKDRIIEWARNKQFELLYGEKAIEAFTNKKYDELMKIVERAQSITMTKYNGIWLHDSLDLLFQKKSIESLTSGFSHIDQWLHGCGPAKKEVLVWAAKTGGGKSIVMVNSGVACARMGKKVLHLTLETAAIDILRRYVGSITKMKMESITHVAEAKFKKEEFGTDIPKEVSDLERILRDRIKTFKSDSGEGSVLVHEFEADAISINDIKQYVDHLKKTIGWVPDVIIIDYMELMVPRNAGRGDQDNKEYLRQKKLATEVRALAQSEDVLVITATQGNRQSVMTGNDDKKKGPSAESSPNMGLGKLSNSYDKAMPMDYIISINQDNSEQRGVGGDDEVGKFRFYIEKNRHGPNGKWVHALVHYPTMVVTQQSSGDVKIGG